MKIILLTCLLLSFAAQAQINRSANELARENISKYVNSKIFKDRGYQAVSYGELKEDPQVQSEVAWRVEHRFRIGGDRNAQEQNSRGRGQFHRFTFYLNKKMKVLGAEEIKFP